LLASWLTGDGKEKVAEEYGDGQYSDGLTKEYGDGLTKEYDDGLVEEYGDGLAEK